jgi:hypothetical protein
LPLYEISALLLVDRMLQRLQEEPQKKEDARGERDDEEDRRPASRLFLSNSSSSAAHGRPFHHRATEKASPQRHRDHREKI